MSDIDTQKAYQKASLATADDLRTMARAINIREISELSLPQVDAIADLVGRIIPAGNVPGVILSGLANLRGRKPPPQEIRRDVNLIFKGLDQVLDKAVYHTFFAGPAAVIWGYQNLLKLAGKDPTQSFPEGTWQFYVDYALREDTARHTNETHGFDTTLNAHQIQLSLLDRITAWVMTSIHILHQYPALLANEWRERVHIQLLYEVTTDEDGNSPYANLYKQWERQRPYVRGHDVTNTEDYPTYRRLKFERFLRENTQDLAADIREEWYARISESESHDLPNYQQQMSILGYLEPELYGEQRRPLPIEACNIGIFYGGYYFLIPACYPNTRQPTDINTVRGWLNARLQNAPQHALIELTPIVKMKRTALSQFRKKLDDITRHELDILRTCPIILNFDGVNADLPLAELRQVERGVGDHALTIIDTGRTLVFDQSHIYFDGAGGAALAEIMTNDALAWAVYLQNYSTPQPNVAIPYTLNINFRAEDVQFFESAPQINGEVSAETDQIHIKRLLAVRKMFKQRSDLLRVTVNDLLILYRAIHAVTYQPTDNLRQAIEALEDEEARNATLAALDEHHNPAILIPVDASQASPRDRLYPMSFTVPLDELDLLNLHEQSINFLDAYEQASGGRRGNLYEEFDRYQRTYLATIAGFGDVMLRAKEIALAGQSSSVGTIKLLAHMPTPLQRLLDEIPGRFEVLNDIIKGREVFSNVGAVASTSTLTRFITAKDDNDKKTLAWGVITTADGTMRMSLRDFRPHIKLLLAAGEKELAQVLTEDYLVAYAEGFNQYIQDLQRITLASRETRLQK